MSRTERVGRYEVVTHLASGGMGQVYLAKIPGLGGFERHVILKTLAVGESDEDDAAAMFLDEARVLGILHHHHIAAVYEVGRDEQHLYLVMDYVHGHTAHEVWQRTVDVGAALPIDFSLTVASAAASGLHYAHTRRGPTGRPLQIVHRDVTLSNLIIGFDGAVKLIDFGIAMSANRTTQTAAGYVKGKVGYMAPEQIRGQDVDARTDVFALGIVLYELTTMRRCFREDTDRATVERIKQGSFALPSSFMPDYPRELERIVTRALRVDPRERYPDADTIRRELEALGHRLELVLGDAAIVEVMPQLFEDHHEPWQRRTSRAETELAVSLEVTPTSIDDDLTRPTQAAPRALSKPLRAATEVADALIIALETPPLGVPASPAGSSKDTDGVPVLIPLPLPAKDSEPVGGTPRAVMQTDTDALTVVQSPPSAATAAPPPAKRPPPIARTTRKVSRPRAPSSPWSGWIAAGIVFAAAIIGGIFLVREEGSPAEAKASSAAAGAPRDAGVGVVVVVPDAAVVAVPAVDAAIPDAAPTSVTLRITSNPSGATLILDGQKLGKTPYEGTVDADPGTHVLKLRRKGYATIKVDVQLDADLTRELTLRRRGRGKNKDRPQLPI